MTSCSAILSDPLALVCHGGHPGEVSFELLSSKHPSSENFHQTLRACPNWFPFSKGASLWSVVQITSAACHLDYLFKLKVISWADIIVSFLRGLIVLERIDLLGFLSSWDEGGVGAPDTNCLLSENI